jgi:glucosamine 6-phosphate synthetase-like amidotransferase/phosphosugar isomerase protein
VIPDLFAADLAAKPDALADLAAHLRANDPWADAGIDAGTHLVLLGMGSSHYANAVAAARLRTLGVDAVAELASSDLLPAVRPGTVVVAVSASGGSAETLDALSRYAGRCPIVAMTNVAGSAVEADAAEVVSMLAGEERGGVACRSYQHTLALWLDLEARLTGGSAARAAVADVVERTAVASADLLSRRDAWLPELSAFALGPDGTHLVAPARRMSSAQQGALMLREGPRRPAVGCETGDWSHVDVYLTKTTDYRLVLFAGSRWEPALLDWVAKRGSTLVAVGDDVPGAAMSLRYAGDEDDDVRLLSEVLVPELVSSSVWGG